MTMSSDDALALVTPVTIGQPVAFRVRSKGRKVRDSATASALFYELTLAAAPGADGVPQISAAVAAADAARDAGFRDLGLDSQLTLTMLTSQLCECHREVLQGAPLRRAGPQHRAACPCPRRPLSPAPAMWGDPRLAADLPRRLQQVRRAPGLRPERSSLPDHLS
jgi:hypothetical protein